MVKIKQQPTRQRLRKALLFLSLLLFPATLYYFSPMLILQGVSEGIVNGSMIVFGSMFLSALFAGRLWCGWACPAGALQEFGQPINNKRTPGGAFHWIKWAIWVPWTGLIVALFLGLALAFGRRARGFQRAGAGPGPVARRPSTRPAPVVVYWFLV